MQPHACPASRALLLFFLHISDSRAINHRFLLLLLLLMLLLPSNGEHTSLSHLCASPSECEALVRTRRSCAACAGGRGGQGRGGGGQRCIC